MPKFNKMFVMLPVMFLARKLDGEDPTIVYWLRISYAVMQLICVAIVSYTYVQATTTSSNTSVVYVPEAAVPFADPAAKKKYTETSFGKHVVSQARSLLGSTLFGIVLTVGLHYYKGMVMGLAIQTVMAPLNLLENALVKALFLGSGKIDAKDKIFDEKTATELTNNDEIVDEQGNPVVRSIGGGKDGSGTISLEDVLLDTWDMGNKADLGPLMKALNKTNCNYQTKDDQWTPLMILSGLGAKGTVSAIRTLVSEYNADISITDKEGWTCYHWAAFHNSLTAAKELISVTSSSSKYDVKTLLAVKDKDSNTPIETAKKEGNDDVAAVYEKALGESKKSK